MFRPDLGSGAACWLDVEEEELQELLSNTQDGGKDVFNVLKDLLSYFHHIYNFLIYEAMTHVLLRVFLEDLKRFESKGQVFHKCKVF